LRQTGPTHPLNEVVHKATVNDAAEHGRFRCLGGTSTRWGGVLIPFQEVDLDRGDWPVGYEDLAAYIPQVESLFGLEPGPYTDDSFPFDLGDSHVNRLAKRPVFKKRNVIDLFGKACRETENLDVCLNATVTEIRAEPDGSGVHVVARSLGGDSIRIDAARLVIAAGAIETTRLALLIDRQNGGAVRARSPSLGHYFADHVSIGVAEIVPSRPEILNRTLGFRFDSQGGLRPIRFELAPDAGIRRQLPPSYIYLDFEVVRPSSFDALREMFRHLQMRRLPPYGTFASVLREIPWLMRAAWWRVMERRLLYPNRARLFINVAMEQSSEYDNRISLSDERFDPLGVPLAEIEWRISDADTEAFDRTAELFREAWDRSGLGAMGSWTWYPREEIRHVVQASGGVFHPTGSTRMGRDASTGVVDGDLRMFAFPQIRLLATSVMPTGGGANPTMMLLMMMFRCVDQLARESTGAPVSDGREGAAGTP
jgi:choline dehydrogenase-like flavoprotein